VKVALELHPQNLVFNSADVLKLVELTGATHVGVELDASHLFWQQMDPVAVVRALGPLIFFAAAKDVRVNSRMLPDVHPSHARVLLTQASLGNVDGSSDRFDAVRR